ncbi:putative RNA-binding protein RbpA [Symbiodinium microadriaticum]|uniref:Putative RNA-binding protein RbpA n=1 Tax=Symbiodinium microadriaticum TaxID=2951 RepID=A0A1Q9E1J0_SYMMI|nr:putative RNA-binding protein RbpA [Symbiodinium microadriaticum]
MPGTRYSAVDIAKTARTCCLPITFGIRDIEKIFSRHGEVKLVQIPHHRETGEPRGFCLIEFGSVKVLLEASNDRVSKLQGNELDCAPLNAQASRCLGSTKV